MNISIFSLLPARSTMGITTLRWCAAINYLRGNGILNSLDMQIEAKAKFLEAFQQTILEPRGLSYKLQFTGPSGANVVEAALTTGT
ncbi:hypothetical protein HZU77_005610 [Neisseriaceae bacterium TC5R-5]|nr:hypothetical protein [Neisseriaceae bacterium TC5R-5]